MNEQIKNAAKERLSNLIQRYNATTRLVNHNDVSEETIRTWLNEFLSIFGWDVQNTNQVLQEHVLRGVQQQRLRQINSPHRRPDYTLLNGTNIKTFLDAKSLDVDIFTDASAAYQIRSYGWSAQSPCAFVSNFEQLVIYDTCFIPNPEQPADASVIQIHIDEYLDKFDTIIDHLWHDNICTNHLEELYSTTAVEGRNRVDSQFMGILSSFRKELATNLYANNAEIITNNESLNYYTQVILDRIVFIRVCESKGIEEQEKLRSFANSEDGFWASFKNSCYMEFYEHYDGAMFSRDALFNQLNIDNDVLSNFINKLYIVLSKIRCDIIDYLFCIINRGVSLSIKFAKAVRTMIIATIGYMVIYHMINIHFNPPKISCWEDYTIPCLIKIFYYFDNFCE